MKKRNFKSTGIGLSILLSATALLVLQLSGGGRLTASDSDEPMTQAVVSSRVIAEHPPVEIVEKRDDHTRIWEIVREVETTHPDGSATVESIKSYIHEKASWLCYRDASRNFVPSVPEWREVPDGFVIDRCGYWLSIGNTIGSGLRYILDGHELLLRAAYLMISDGANEAHLAVLNPDASGFILPGSPSVVRFPSAFGPGYDLEYIAEKGGFHQNLIISNAPELPAGFNSATASIHLYTELNLDQYISASGCQVTVEGEPLNTSAADLVTEPSRGGCISFTKDGRLLHAFSVSQVSDSSGPGALDKQTTAEKRLMKDPSSGKSYLVESLPVSYFADNSPTYPITWDYNLKSGALNNDETWCPRYTYYLSSTLTVGSGKTLTIEPGTVVKLKGQSTHIAVSGTLMAVGEAYNYVTFTSAHDDDCGEDLDGPGKPLPEANPQEGDYYAAFVVASGEVTLRDSQAQYCKVAYGTSGAVATVSPYEMEHDVRDCIFRKCVFGLVLCAPTDPANPAAVRNNLFFDVGVAITLYGANYLGIYNNTFDGPGKASDRGVWFWGTANGVQIKYNIFTNLTDAIDNGTISTPIIQHNAFYQTPSEGDYAVLLGATPFESSTGLGDHYLNNEGAGQACRSGNWTAAPADVGLNDKAYTVNKPNEVSGIKSGVESWGIISNAATENPVALGYHHNRADYNMTADVKVAGAGVLTVGPGVVVCIGDAATNRSLIAERDGTINCQGDLEGDGPIVMTTCPASSMFVKSRTFDSTTGGSLKIEADAGPNSRASYTRFLWNTQLHVYRALGSPVESNRFECSYYGLYRACPTVARNNLFYVCNYGLYESGQFAGASVSVNNTFDHCSTGYRLETSGSSCRAIVRDCLFTKCGYGIDVSTSGGATLKEFNNAFWKNITANYRLNGASQGLHSWDSSLSLSQCPYERPPGNYADGPKENDCTWFLDQSSAWKIVDKGSYWAEIAGHGDHFFSTRKSTGERDTSEADIGWHPWYKDSDHDGMPDVWETTFGLNPNNSSDASLDADGDGLTNLQEFRAGSQPNNQNSDGDDYDDGDEVGDEDCKSLVGWGPAQHEKFKAGPWLNNLKTNGVTVAWMTANSPGTKEVWTRGESSAAFQLWGGSITSQSFGTIGYVNEAKITGLSAGIWYQYYIVSDTVTTMKFLFRTTPSADEPFKFIVYGDTRGDSAARNQKHRPVVDSILDECDDVRFIVHVGDFALSGGTAQNWIDHFFSGAGPMLAYYPVYPVVGNHEYYNNDPNLTNYKKLFDYQDEATKTWYYVDYCNCRLIILNTGPDTSYTIPDTGTQYQDAICKSDGTGWLRQTPRRKWNLVFAHVPPYSDKSNNWADGANLRGDSNLVGGIRDLHGHGHHADALFAGHSHLYERWLPRVQNEDLVDYFITGGGGAPVGHSYHDYHDGYSQNRVFWEDIWRNFCKVEVTSSSCKVYAYRVDATVDGKRTYELTDEKELHQTNSNAEILKSGQTWHYADLNEYYNQYGYRGWTDYEFGEPDPPWGNSGPASIGYGDAWLTRNLSTPPTPRRTYYFRLQGNLTPTANVLNAIVYHKIDDGCVVYFSEQGKDYGSGYGLYSVEGERFNLPRNVVMKFDTEATLDVEDADYFPENKWRGMTVPNAGDKLKAGKNYLIAVEVHQKGPYTSNDICLDLKVALEYEQQ